MLFCEGAATGAGGELVVDATDGEDAEENDGDVGEGEDGHGVVIVGCPRSEVTVVRKRVLLQYLDTGNSWSSAILRYQSKLRLHPKVM